MESTRTDEQILNEVMAGLASNPSFNASGIEVTVTNGEVSLHGFVDSWESRRTATDIAENVSGVIKVHSELEIRPDPA